MEIFYGISHRFLPYIVPRFGAAADASFHRVKPGYAVAVQTWVIFEPPVVAGSVIHRPQFGDEFLHVGPVSCVYLYRPKAKQIMDHMGQYARDLLVAQVFLVFMRVAAQILVGFLDG